MCSGSKWRRQTRKPSHFGGHRVGVRAAYISWIVRGFWPPYFVPGYKKSTLLLQNRGHAEVLKNDPSLREIRNAGAPSPPPLYLSAPPPRVEIVVLMPILFDISMLSFSQYELKSSEATRFRGSILMRFKSLKPSQIPLHASKLAFKSIEK